MKLSILFEIGFERFLHAFLFTIFIVTKLLIGRLKNILRLFLPKYLVWSFIRLQLDSRWKKKLFSSLCCKPEKEAIKTIWCHLLGAAPVQLSIILFDVQIFCKIEWIKGNWMQVLLNREKIYNKNALQLKT